MESDILGSKSLAFSIVVATTLNGGIGWKGGLPWRLPQDVKFFSAVTTRVNAPGAINAVIMGRKTYESLPEKFRPLPKRLNIVISKSWVPAEKTDAENTTTNENVFQGSMVVASSLDAALQWIAESPLAKQVEKVFVIGGGQIYAEALKSDKLAAIYMTRVTGAVECDCFVEAFKDKGGTASIAVGLLGEPFVPVAITKTYSYGMLTYDFVEYRRARDTRLCSSTHFRNCLSSPAGGRTAWRAAGGLEAIMEAIDPENTDRAIPCIGSPSVMWRGHEEFQYLDLVAQIITQGVDQADRTGVGTRALFGAKMRFDLRNSFPLLTTKAVFWRGVVEELLWFIRGETSSKHLSEKGVKIWDANGSREFLDSLGFYDRQEGDLGPVYGFQWRHFGAEYIDAQQDYGGKGIDQLNKAIELLKTDPYSRRIIISAWNPAALHKMALPPCHMFCQFFVTPSKHLSCVMYQRSGDMGLGVPFNIASYALLCYIMAQVCDLIPGEFIHVIGNAHVYLNHIQPLKVQLERVPRPFPTLHIDPAVKDINQLDASNFKLVGYMPHPKIPMQFAV